MELIKSISKEDLKLLVDIKRAVSKTTDAVVKRSSDGSLVVYENKIKKVS